MENIDYIFCNIAHYYLCQYVCVCVCVCDTFPAYCMNCCSVSWQPTSWRYCSLYASTVSMCVLCFMANPSAL